MNVTESRSAKAAQKMCNALNAMCFDYDVFADTVMREHRTIQQNVFKAILKLIEHWAAMSSSHYDGRNEKTVQVCQKIVAALDPEDFQIPNI
jgi:hypothetical protein